MLSVAEDGGSYTISCLGTMEDNFIVQEQFFTKIA